ncbi:hypothetical protein ACN2WE_05265 [Streptomyces sp. cg28]|uniref:hypothetical protein n=1 Tax=Streptomyces sp. cg28 TaxID=3403457 RepID=UPI003B20F8B8
MTAYDPLHTPDEEPAGPFNLDAEIAATQQILDDTAGLNIHNDAEMVKAAVTLDTTLRTLLAAIVAERGEGR